MYYYYSQTLDKYKYYILCIFYTWLVSLTSQLELLTSRAELAFWLVRITRRAELARYLNEPERAEPKRAELARYPALVMSSQEQIYQITIHTP